VILGLRHDETAPLRLRSRIALVAPEAATSWVHVGREGDFAGKGGFSLTRDVFAQAVENFETQANPIPVLYEHPIGGDGEPVPAAGWIHALELRDYGLWAEVEWTERAARMIREGEYRYCSMVLALKSKHRETGEEIGAQLLELGLTNTPFIDGLAPIKLTRHEMATKPILRLHSALGITTRGSRGHDQARRTTLALLCEHAGLESAKAAEVGKPGVVRLSAADRKRLAADIVKLVDVDAVQDALDILPDDAEPEAILAVVDAAIQMEEALDEDTPAPTVEAAADEDDKTAMADDDDDEKKLADGDPMSDAVTAVADAMGATADEVAMILVARAGEVAALLSGEAPEGDGGADATMLKRLSATESTLARIQAQLKAEQEKRAKAELALDTERFETAVLSAKGGGMGEGEEKAYRALFARDAAEAIKLLSAHAGTVTPPKGRVTTHTSTAARSIDAIEDKAEQAKAIKVELSALTDKQRDVYNATRLMNAHKGHDHALRLARGGN
jgi:hypothetical protein